MLFSSPVIFFEYQDGVSIASVILDTIDANKNVLQEYFYERISSYNDKSEREWYDKLKSV